MTEMHISDLKLGSSRVSIKAKIVKKDEIRDIKTKFGQSRVCNARIEDDTGSISLVLWGEEVEKVHEGDHITIENGFVKEWNGELQVSAGKYGKIEVV